MPVRVLVVDDSAYLRRTLTRIIASDPGLEVVGTAGDGEEAIRRVISLAPDVVTLDLEMPRMDGYAFLRWIMRASPRPVLVVSSGAGSRSVFRALDLGAADFVLKPVSHASERVAEIEGAVLEKIHQIAAARPDKLADRAERLAHAPEPSAVSAPPPPAAAAAGGEVRCVAIGASTGGPPALQQVLAAFPPSLPAAVLIAQHMPEGFTRMFAERLDRLVGMQVREAADGEAVGPGVALIAPGGRHLTVRRGPGGRVTARVAAAGPRDRYVPSVDLLLQSAAEAFRQRLTGVVLTGMGDDGLEGVKTVRRLGGRTVAESEETCVVFGMPREAIRSGAVDRVLPLPEIGPALLREALRA